MLIQEIIEGATPIFGKTGNKVVRKYRCTTGSRKGRIVAKPSTCSAPKNIKASNTAKKVRRARGSTAGIKSTRTKRTNAASIRTRKINKARTRPRPAKRNRKRI